MEKIVPAPAFTDERGEIIDLIENEDINAVTVVTFTKGAVRGNHFHEHTTQWNYVLSGRIKLVTQAPGRPPEETLLQAGELAVMVPGVRHAFVGVEASRLIVFTKGPRGGKEYETDTFRLETPLVGK